MTEKRFSIKEVSSIDFLASIDVICDEGIELPTSTACDLLNKLNDENEELKQFISKIDFAIIRKYDNSVENLLDEVYDGEYENWIKKQVLRAKKIDGDVND